MGHDVNHLVRLSDGDLKALKQIFRKHFLPQDRLWLFGSRVDLTRKGGDIDLYIETHSPTPEEAVNRRVRFLSNLEAIIGEQKIDVVLNQLNSDYDLPIYAVAKTEGVLLVTSQFNEMLKIADIHAGRVRQALLHIQELFPIHADIVSNISEENFAWIEVWIGRFSKLQDYLSSNLIDAFLTHHAENIDKLMMIDKLNKCERLGIIEDVEVWHEMRSLGNKLAHEYPDNPDFTAESLNQVFALTPKLLEILENIKQKGGAA